ncbi:Uncharacterised protein [Fusobacterium polymorphum]|uniref:DUF3805 domain-containing protein n=1 Tax=Fusobacterium polymorphum ATCC 10953 TaxID=393480 RepID=A5TUU1_FUSNP|nr:hypothetical protein [Fusobacterium polymorphum]EDK88666.1 hypothetical protein FNP_0866 [Fusobacterium polymorphum ATCC 10953]UTI52049.1 hypothetical protein NLJ26_06365 [Fusobacterium polymorphum]WRL68774.1 hypothetical protein VKN78_01470 [Fusobacterium polymorphum]CKG93638.1 Uncharacterised protein [Fusobacterium polymorphum]
MKIFNIDNGWTIKLPENWKEEKDEVDGYHIYYSLDTDLTIRTPTFHFFRETENGWKMFAPIDILSEIFDESIKNIELRDDVKAEERELNLNNFKIEDFKIKCYEYTYYEDSKEFYVIATGIFMKGYLLKANIASTIKKEVEKAMYYLFSIKEADPKEVEFFKKVNSYKE